MGIPFQLQSQQAVRAWCGTGAFFEHRNVRAHNRSTKGQQQLQGRSKCKVAVLVVCSPSLQPQHPLPQLLLFRAAPCVYPAKERGRTRARGGCCCAQQQRTLASLRAPATARTSCTKFFLLAL
ncbi:uncharacterized protein [Aegilops tauschii subsp. strangulata]|uniref:uncharacterized protein n=1 Tax=Aegilops tauschii subsp. strangulata TaxID=200361 RepID=UPI00098A8D6D|nr:uncharacterized protein LOC109755284 isoform X2 [Aegilops tauschii subsp. strangulata]